jgi:phage-related protein
MYSSRTRLGVTLAAAGLSTAALVGCSVGAVDKALDCAQTAATVAQDVQDLQNVVGNAGNSPQDAATALDRISQDLKNLGKKTSGADVGKAVDELQKAVRNARTAADNGTVPDVTPVAYAAGALSKVCAPG